MLRAMDARRNSCSYSDDDFEKDDDDAGWTRISIKDIDMGREIGGGGVALVYEGYFRDEPVALKTLFDPKVDAALQKEYLDELLVMARVEEATASRVASEASAAQKEVKLFSSTTIWLSVKPRLERSTA